MSDAPLADAPLVLVTSRSFGSGRADPAGLLTQAGLRVVRGDPRHDLDALRGPLAEAAAWIAGTAPVTHSHFAHAPQLRLLARYGAGVDAVDLAAATARGVLVTNTPGANAEAVADHTLALLLALLRHLIPADRSVRAGHADPLIGRELAGLAVGLVGMGTIGRAVARRLRALGLSVSGFDPQHGPESLASLGVTWRPLPELVAGCEAVSLHCPGGGPPVLDRGLLATLPAGAVVVNAARADVVDESALADLLHAGHLGGVATDVLSGPDSPLLHAPRTVLTPHIAGHTVEAIDRMGMAAAAEVVRVLVEQAPPAHLVPTAADSAG